MQKLKREQEEYEAKLLAQKNEIALKLEKEKILK